MPIRGLAQSHSHCFRLIFETVLVPFPKDRRRASGLESGSKSISTSFHQRKLSGYRIYERSTNQAMQPGGNISPAGDILASLHWIRNDADIRKATRAGHKDGGDVR